MMLRLLSFMTPSFDVQVVLLRRQIKCSNFYQIVKFIFVLFSIMHSNISDREREQNYFKYKVLSFSGQTKICPPAIDNDKKVQLLENLVRHLFAIHYLKENKFLNF